MKNTHAMIIVLVVLAGGALLLIGTGKKAEAPATDTPSSMDSQPNVTNMPSIPSVPPGTPPVGTQPLNTDANQANLREFVVEGKNFSFSPSLLTVKKGDRVRIIFKNTGGFHDFKLDEFGVQTQQAQGPYEETVEFVASKAGSFEFYCSVGTHRAMGMKGTLRVE